MPLLERFISTIAPHMCVGCGVEGQLICARCSQKLPRPVNRCYRCHAVNDTGRTCSSCRKSTPLRYVDAVTRYEGMAKDMVWRLKFNNAQAAASEIGELMSAYHSKVPKSTPTLIVPVPTATSRVRRRGYDQATLIAKTLASRQELRYIPLLRRYGHQQQHGASRLLRIRQLKEAFEVRQNKCIQGAHIILIDDVLTTGATLEAAAGALKAAGAKTIDAIVFAQA